jgi:hypothetical protein
MKKKISGTPPTPLKRPILGEQKPKWAVSPRRVCATVLKFYMGFLLTKIIRFQCGVSRCADTGARTPIGISGIVIYFCNVAIF